MFREDELVIRRQKVNGDWIETPYPKLGGGLRVLHEQHEVVSITTEIVRMTPESVVVRATIQTDKGSYSGTGTASVQRDAGLADALLELAESRSIARSARIAGVGGVVTEFRKEAFKKCDVVLIHLFVVRSLISIRYGFSHSSLLLKFKLG